MWWMVKDYFSVVRLIFSLINSTYIHSHHEEIKKYTDRFTKIPSGTFPIPEPFPEKLVLLLWNVSFYLFFFLKCVCIYMYI